MAPDAMPIYEYRCLSCGTEFEKLVRSSSPSPLCPGCQSSDLQRKLSPFAAHGGGEASAPAAPSPCGACGAPGGPGSCRFR